MKKLLLVRHAKSSWDHISQPDFERTLNDRGHRDAPRMAKRLLKEEIEIDAFLSSPAVRALTTAEYFAEAWDVKKKHVVQEPALYHPTAEVFFDVISRIDDRHNCVAIFSHNPGITEFANTLCSHRVDDMPTCAVFAVKADIKSWKDFREAEKKFWFFDYPKHHE
ncbi:MAG TPA: histidine phosphatase family protein [Chitinophagaceae bacterium]